MKYVCPSCGDWWGATPDGVIRTPMIVRTCIICEGAFADVEDARADARANGEGV